MQIVRYEKQYQTQWNHIVDESRNATFLFHRSYMDYHADRIEDASLLVFDENNHCIALFPASVNIEAPIVYSHAGLTYGGILLNQTTKTVDIKEIFKLITNYYIDNGYKHLIYKPIPYIYHKSPAQEDLYWLFKAEAILASRNISTTIDLNFPILFTKLRERKINKARKENLTIKQDNTYLAAYWSILSDVLKERHGVAPVHTLDEITKLADSFPQNIKLYTIHNEQNDILAGILTYITTEVVHVQYIAVSEVGRSIGALDLLFSEVIKMTRENGSHRFFDFGISTENGGNILNEGLIFQKEGFGGHGVCYDSYMVNLQKLAEI